MSDIERNQLVERAFAGMNIGTVFAGLAFGSGQIDLNVILLVFLLILLRVKFWFDDEAYLTDVSLGKLPGGLSFHFGMFLAFASWIVWTFAAFYVKNLELSSIIMVAVFAISTCWVVAALVKRGAYAEQVPWLFFNALYALGFILIYFRNELWNPFRNHLHGFTTGVLTMLFVLFIVDLSVTRILEQKRRPPENGAVG